MATLVGKITERIETGPRQVYLRNDFADLGSDALVGRALRQLIEAAKLLRISHGLHAMARISRFTGEPMLASHGGFRAVAEESLDRLGADWSECEAYTRYQAGETTQVPVNYIPIVYGRFTRTIATGPFTLKVELRPKR